MRAFGKNAEMSQVIAGEVKGREMFGHAIAGFGQNLIFGLWSNYMLVFYTDIFGIAAGTASIIMLLTRVWDGINDPMMGSIADRTRTKWGRYRPWLLFMAPVIVIFLVLNFSSPDLSPTLKVVYAGITYVMMSMAFTAVDVPYWTMPAAMSSDVKKRSRIISFSRMSTTLAATILGIIAIPLIHALGQGDKQKGYMMTALVVGLIGAGFYLIGFCCIREHVQPALNQKITFKSSVKAIIQNKPLLLLLCCGLLGNIGTMLKQGMVIYYVKDCVGSENLIPTFSLLFLPGMIFGLIIAPVFAKRFDSKSVFIGARVFGIIVDVIFFFAGFENIPLVMFLYALTSIPLGISSVVSKSVFIGARVFGIIVDVIFFFAGFENIPLVMFLYALTSIPLGISSVVSATMLTNTIEYAEWKFGNRQEGLISSTQTLTAKIGMALSAGVIGAVLEIADYVPNHVTSETQMMMHGAFTLFCAFIGVLAIIPMLFNKFTDKEHQRIMNELAERKSQK